MQLTEHFALEELTHSDTAARHGIDNTPTGEHLANLRRTAETMEVVRKFLANRPIQVHSGYRSPAVNALVGGVHTSAHCRGLACDFVCPAYGDTYAVAKAVWHGGIIYDQLILEYGWVHIGLADTGKVPRFQLLTKRSAHSPYESGLLK